jgi:hypothetical protein
MGSLRLFRVRAQERVAEHVADDLGAEPFENAAPCASATRL